jgi:prefoldin subunit 5
MDFDLAASSLRADGADIPAFIETLAAKLEAALPQRTRVQRQAKRMFSKDKRVQGIEVSMGENAYTLSLRGDVAQGRRAKTVRGIAIKSEELTLDAWLQALTAELADEAQRSEASRRALQELLG